MLKQGWVRAEWVTSSTNRRVRSYTITPAGRKHLQEELSSFEQMMESIRRILAPAES